MRYIIYGTGAIGGLLAGVLSEQKSDVICIARGENLDVLQQNGLTLISPKQHRTIPVTALADTRTLSWETGDCCIVATKTQDSEPVFAALAATAPPNLPVICAQNGVENERLAYRFFRNVYGMHVYLPADHLVSGTITYYCEPTIGVLDIGRYPQGEDAFSRTLAHQLSQCRMSAKSTPDIMAWKYTKLLGNLGNALEALCGPFASQHPLLLEAIEEAQACYRASNITWIAGQEEQLRHSELSAALPISGSERPGGSTWQSIARGLPRTEVDYLNGEIVLLGRLCGIPTPVNATLQSLVHTLAAAGTQPGKLPIANVEHAVAQAKQDDR